MSKAKGTIKTGGRKKGSKNKITRTVKKTVLDTFIGLQRNPEFNMRAWAKKNITEFYKISSKLIPTEVEAFINDKSLFKIYSGIDKDKI